MTQSSLQPGLQPRSLIAAYVADAARRLPSRETLVAVFFALLMAKMALPIPVLALYVPTVLVMGLLFLHRTATETARVTQPNQSRRSVLAYLLLCAAVGFYLLGVFRSGGILYQNNRTDSVGLFLAVALPLAMGGLTTAGTALLWRETQRWAWVACVFIALLSIVKFVFLLNGQELAFLNFIYQLDSRDYPGGTALTTDYNFYALCMLIGVLSAARLATDAASPRWMRILAALTLPLISVSVLFAGSRRGWISLAILALVGVAVYAKRLVFDQPNRVGQRGGVLIALILAVGLAGTIGVMSAQDTEDQSELERLWARFGTITGENATFDESFDSRIESWDLGLYEIIPRYTPAQLLFGKGFSYLKEYAHEFPIYYPDEYYPHNPIISAIHYSGLIGALVITLLLAASGVYALVLARRLGLYVLLVYGVFLTFNFVSNNSIFSAPALTVALMLMLMSESAARHTPQQSQTTNAKPRESAIDAR